MALHDQCVRRVTLSHVPDHQRFHRFISYGDRKGSLGGTKYYREAGEIKMARNGAKSTFRFRDPNEIVVICEADPLE